MGSSSRGSYNQNLGLTGINWQLSLVIYLFAISALVPSSIAQPSFDSISTTTDTVPSSSSIVEDPCANYPCANGGTCRTVFGLFNCECPAGYGGETCTDVVANTLYPFGWGQKDAMLADTDDGGTPRQWVEHGVQIYCHRHRNFFAEMNGYISFNTRYDDPSPVQPDSGRLQMHDDDLSILAPLWVDNAGGPASGNESVVFYQSYTKWASNHAVDDKTTAMMNLATHHIHEYTGKVDFQASNVIVVTWWKAKPFPYDPNSEEECSYQLVIISDHSLYRTYAMFNYRECSYVDSRDNAIFTFAQKYMNSGPFIYNKWGFSGTPLAFGMPGHLGNVGIKGRLLYRVTTDDCEDDHGSEYQCRIWMVNQMNNKANINSLVPLQRPCPCTLMQALLDPFFVYTLKDLCFVTRGSSAQRCCYDRFRLTGRLLPVRMFVWLLFDIPLRISRTFASGSFIYHNEVLNPYAYLESDYTPKDHCCRKSDLCHVYYKYRPMNYCFGYVPPLMSWLFGDPHIRTLDGLEYTYNGFGEFWMQKPVNSPVEDYFRLQARTSFAWDEQGNNLQATVFVAFAAKDPASARVHVELTEDRQSMLILVDDAEANFTDWFYNTTDLQPEIFYKDVFFRRLLEDMLLVLFPGGVGMRVTARGAQLDCMLIVDEEYEKHPHIGLMGTYNGNTSDDFTVTYGDAPLPLDSSPSVIHDTFGESFRIKTSESLFWYEVQEEAELFQDPNFQPIMEPLTWTNDLEKQAAEDLCLGDTSCMYDFYVTKNTDFASVTRDISVKNTDTEKEVRNNVPVIDGPSEIHVTVLEEYSATITVTDVDPQDTVSLEYVNLPDGATFINNVFKWTPQDMSEVPDFKFIATDSRNASAVDLDITVKLCNCSNHGTCDFENSLPEYNTTDTFQMVYCFCDIEWTGVYCESDLDACLDDPCIELQGCVDIDATAHKQSGKGFNCTSCPSGYLEVVGVKCEDINECTTGAHDCDANTTDCVNFDGGYYCDCKPNFVEILDNTTHCADFDECDLHLDDCEQICTNAFGGYECDCHTGYTVGTDGKTCNLTDPGLISDCQSKIPNCQGSCVDDGAGTVKCDCGTGYELVPGSKEVCQDFNECENWTEPCGNSSIGYPKCTNTNGSYTCKCLGGFLQGDIRSCGECEPGQTWGVECSNLCNCGDGAVCDPVTGCEFCQPGWKGDPGANDCSQDIDECALNATICGDNSNCTNTMGSYKCICHEGYYRDIDGCTEINECVDVDNSIIVYGIEYCLHGATCIDKFLGVECICANGFTGVQCETNIDECVPENANSTQHCLHNSTCNDLIYNFECICVGDYFGHYCQHILAPPETTTIPGNVTGEPPVTGVPGSSEGAFPVLAVALGTVLGAIALVLLVICVCYCCCRVCAVGDDTSSTTTEPDTFSRPSHILPRPTWLHWYPGVALKPAYMVRTGTPMQSSSSGPSRSRHSPSSASRSTPAIDWSILKRFSSRTGPQGGLQPASQFHRGPAPYTTAGDFFWMSRSRGTDVASNDNDRRTRTRDRSRDQSHSSRSPGDQTFSWTPK